MLLFPLYWLSQPATNAASGVQGKPGGMLARLRNDYHLSEAQLGEIDPGSVTIKLATLGMRGVAANILWEKATDYKMRKDWTNFGATLNQITKVQPNFINVWTNQAWNLSYNFSVEFDDYRERYRWVIKGFDFLNDGIKYNEDQPRFAVGNGPDDLAKDRQGRRGQTVPPALGRRHRLPRFAAAGHARRLSGLPRPSRQLAGRQGLVRKVGRDDRRIEDAQDGPKPADLPFQRTDVPDELRRGDGEGRRLRRSGAKAWADASTEWHRYGSEDIPSSFTREGSDEPIILHLNEEEAEAEIAKQKIAELEKMQPGLREKIIAEKKAALPSAQRIALDTPETERTEKQRQLAFQAAEAIGVGHDEVARRITGSPERREAAKKLAKEAREHEQLSMYTNRYRSTVNFDYWNSHAKTEQGRDLLTARQLIYKGDRAYADGDMKDAESFYWDGLQAWRKVLDAHQEYLKDQTTNEDLIDIIRRYRQVLAQRDKKLPQPFILQDVIDVHQREFGGTWSQEEEKPKKDKKAEVEKKGEQKKAEQKKAAAAKPRK